jgi:hypothetical protein
MRTAIKFQLIGLLQDLFIQCLVLREKIKRFFNPNPRSFWDL